MLLLVTVVLPATALTLALKLALALALAFGFVKTNDSDDWSTVPSMHRDNAVVIDCGFMVASVRGFVFFLLSPNFFFLVGKEK